MVRLASPPHLRRHIERDMATFHRGRHLQASLIGHIYYAVFIAIVVGYGLAGVEALRYNESSRLVAIATTSILRFCQPVCG